MIYMFIIYIYVYVHMHAFTCLYRYTLLYQNQQIGKYDNHMFRFSMVGESNMSWLWLSFVTILEIIELKMLLCRSYGVGIANYKWYNDYEALENKSNKHSILA